MPFSFEVTGVGARVYLTGGVARAGRSEPEGVVEMSVPTAVSRLLEDQRTRFLLVGGTNTVVGYLLFAAFDLTVFADAEYGHLASLLSSYAIAITMAFGLYRRFVFEVEGRLVRDFLAFVSVNLFALGVNAVLLQLLVGVAGIPALIAQAVALATTVLISFFGHREVSFGR